MKNVGLFFLVTVWSLLLPAGANARPSDLPLSPLLVKPLNYASFFSAVDEKQKYVQNLEANKALMYQLAGSSPDYITLNSATETASYSISPYWFYVLKIIVLIVVLLWDSQGKSSSRKKRH